MKTRKNDKYTTTINQSHTSRFAKPSPELPHMAIVSGREVNSTRMAGAPCVLARVVPTVIHSIR